jgi:hypothetical protein
LNTLSPFVAEVVEEGIPTAIEDGGLRHGVPSRGITAPTLRIIAGFQSTFQTRPAGYGHGTNPSIASVGPRTPQLIDPKLLLFDASKQTRATISWERCFRGARSAS